LYGQFKDKKLSELSDAELAIFLRGDARFQSGPCASSLLGVFPPLCPDLSQYWFAKYELERRKPEAQRTAFDIAKADTKEDIAWKLVNYSFRAVSRKYHSDLGGDDATMRRIIEARDYIRALLKK